MRLRAVPLLYTMLVASILCVAVPARADVAITVSPTVTKKIGDTTPSQQRGPAGVVAINHEDCTRDMTLTFNLSMTGLTTTYDLQVWGGQSGANCTDNNNRTGTGSSACRPIASSIRTSSAAQAITVRAQDLASVLKPFPQPNTYTAADATACESATSASAITVGVFFLLMNGTEVLGSQSFKSTATGTSTSGTTPTTTGAEGVVVDLKGPPAPTGIAATTGDRRLRVTWAGNGDRDTKGYVVYCQRAADVPASDAGTKTVCADVTTSSPDTGTGTGSDADVDADIDGAVAEDAAASTSDAAAPSTPDAGCTTSTTDDTASCPKLSKAATLCGSITGLGATSADTDRVLDNLVEYAVGVAAVDAYDNAGDISTTSGCATPEAVNDFWKKFNEDGGDAGGFCALEAVGLPSGSNPAFVALGLAAVLVHRRRRAKS